MKRYIKVLKDNILDICLDNNEILQLNKNDIIVVCDGYYYYNNNKIKFVSTINDVRLSNKDYFESYTEQEIRNQKLNTLLNNEIY